MKYELIDINTIETARYVNIAYSDTIKHGAEDIITYKEGILINNKYFLHGRDLSSFYEDYLYSRKNMDNYRINCAIMKKKDFKLLIKVSARQQSLVQRLVIGLAEKVLNYIITQNEIAETNITVDMVESLNI